MMKIFLTIIFLMSNLQATQTQVIILLGPPGSGKGSQAALIKEKIPIAHISTGDLLRENIKQGTPLGKKAKAYMDAGQLVPDDLVFEMLFARVDKPDCKKGYMLDGFPRNLAQAEALQKRLSENCDVLAISLEVPDTAIVERITKRLICASCQTPYHLIYSPPKIRGKCDLCKGNLYQRSDDTKEIVENRLKIYHEQTAPLIDFYRREKCLYPIASDKPKEKIAEDIFKILYENQSVALSPSIFH